MRLSLREDSQGVASTVATLFTILIVLLLLQASVLGSIPAKMYEAERQTSLDAIAAFDQLRSMSTAVAIEGGQFTVSIPLGTAAVSPFTVASSGTLRFDPEDLPRLVTTYRFVPRLFDATLTKVDQDIILAIDSSGSMVWNDPTRLRISGAKEYVAHLACPDRVAVVDFDSDAHLVRGQIGGPIHHLFSPGNNCMPDYSSVSADLDTIDQSGSTNYGAALRVANDELITYGRPGHAGAIILLTDGQNTVSGADTVARQQAQRAAAHEIIIYTIGLGSDVNAVLLTEIAETTGGTYYAAPTAESIRYIYFEIAMRFKGLITCGTLTAPTSMRGTLSLSLGNAWYPSQTIHLESGGVTVTQPDGSVIHEGIPLRYEPTGLGTGTLHLSALNYVGAGFTASGSHYEFLTAQFLGAITDDAIITRPNLADQSVDVGRISAFLEFWGFRGFATPGAVDAVQAVLENASARLDWGEANMTAKLPTPAKANTESARSYLAGAALEAEKQADAGNMDRALANATKNDILRIGCHLEQWLNWYEGISFTIRSPNAVAWALWFDATYRAAGALMTYSINGDEAVLTIRAIDRFTIEDRVIALAFH